MEANKYFQQVTTRTRLLPDDKTSLVNLAYK